MSTPQTTSDPVAALSSLLTQVNLSHGPSGVNYILSHLSSHLNSTPQSSLTLAYSILDDVLSTPSLLKDRGNERIIKDAFEDGSTLYCKKCKGMIKKDRWTAHVEYWCQPVVES
ncbi:hypothetical protein TrVE_jg176 [Triparma verrucosa]|uniref:C2HC zinc finger plants domain-containing protein n=1 Tax=Triparma verrucosa TaxID=1606542 RepID=A0A9W7EKI9_9STRA|nr:hypothetical protein TrVE_jg176 [Triparma verrucosa]